MINTADIGGSATCKALAQVVFKIVTFLSNGYLMRLVSNEVLGVVYVRLTLLYATTQVLSRETVRKVCLTRHSLEQWPHLISLIWICLPFSIAIAFLLSCVWIFLLEAPTLPFYSIGCVVFAACAVIELLAEPPHIYLMNKQFFMTQVFAEVLANLSQTLFIVVTAHFSSSLIPFITGNFVYSILFVVVYWSKYWSVRSKEDTLFYRKLETSPEYISLAVSFFKQTILKQLLTMGEDYVITFFSIMTFAEQGVFSTVSRLSAIVTRVGFKHIEESYFVFFAQMLKRGMPPHEQGTGAISSCQDTLRHLLRFNFLIGLLITIYGFSYSRLALLIYGGRTLAESSGPALLQWHCLYILICGINGISECFYFATMSQAEVECYNKKLLPFSACFLLLSFILSTVLGATGFVLANMANMGIRIFYSMRYITQYFKSDTVLTSFYLNVPQVLVFSLCGLTTVLSKVVLEATDSMLGNLLHLVIGGLTFVLVLLFQWQCEDSGFKNFIKSLNPIRAKERVD